MAKKRTPWNKGKKMSKELKEKLSQAHKGQVPWNKGTKGKQVPWNKGLKGKIKSHRKGLSLSQEYGTEKAKQISQKISKGQKGRTAWNKGLTKKDNKKLSHSGVKKGNIPWNKGTKGLTSAWNKGLKGQEYMKHYPKGIKQTKANKIAQSKRMKGNTIWRGKTHSEDSRKLIGSYHKGKIVSKKTRRKIGIANTGKTRSKEAIRKFIEHHSGEKHWNFKGWISKEPYGKEFNKQLKEYVRKKYNYRSYLSNKKPKETLHIHHINYNKRDNRKINLIPLTRSEHTSTNVKRNYWFAFFCYHLGIEPEVLIQQKK